jgi:hypothetical protein
MAHVAEKYLRRIHETGGMRDKKALDTIDAGPRNRLLVIFGNLRVDRFRTR